MNKIKYNSCGEKSFIVAAKMRDGVNKINNYLC